ncbi:CapA family protein, partial [Porphyromonas sp.]
MMKSTSRRFLVVVVLSAGFFALSCRPSTASQEQTSTSSVDSTYLLGDTLQLVFAGDIMTHGPQIRAAAQVNGDYDFTSSFEAVRPLIAQADLAVGNLETTFGGSPYSGYPMFSSPKALAVALRYAGFDVLTTANNHSCDRRAYGITHT